jgi:pyruvate/2-oxoglutarate dehydrogenase complex dihydrolipoamide acyltransferase (E2) component
MPLTPVVLPDLGAEPVYLSLWFAAVGDEVFEGDRLVEVLAPCATFDVAAPASGVLVECRAWHPDRLVPGQVLGVIQKSDFLPDPDGAPGPG